MNKTWLCVVLVCWGGLSSSAVAQPALERLEAQVRGLVNQDDGGAANPAGAQAEPGYLGGFFDDRNENGAGVRVTQVLPGGPAERAGLRAGDLITAIDGRQVTTIDEFAAVLGETAPGDKPRFELDRAGRTHRLEVTLGRRPPRDQRTDRPQSDPIGEPGAEQPPDQPRMNLLGVRLLAIDARMAADLQLPVARGALVTEVLEGSPAQAAGLPREAIIVALDGKRVDTPADLARLASQAGAGSEVELTYYSQGRLFERKLRLAALDPALADADEPRPLPEGTEGELPPPEPVTDEDASGRIARLERRVRELEARLAELERLLAEPPDEEEGR
ncbi:MAG: PDZ domain-containing protein [Pirellulales bacterium]